MFLSGELCSILGWGASLSSENSSSLSVKQQHTVVRVPGCVDRCVLGVAGPKEKFSHVET